MVAVFSNNQKVDTHSSRNGTKSDSIYHDSDSSQAKSRFGKDDSVPEHIQKIRKARKSNKSEAEEFPIEREGGLFGKCWDRVGGMGRKCCQWVSGLWNGKSDGETPSAEGQKEKGIFGRAWDYVSDSKTEELPLEASVEKKAQSRINDLCRDFGLVDGNVGYDRNFLSKNKLSRSDLNFFEKCSDPSMMLAYFILNLQRHGNDNSDKAFRSWLKENEKSKIFAKEKLKIAKENVEREKSVARVNSIGRTVIGAVETVGSMVGPGVGTVVAGVVGKVGDMAVNLINGNAVNTINKNKENIEQRSIDINASQSTAAMIAQDIARLCNTQNTLSSILQAIMQDRKERLLSIRM
jgi:hypothetical protein